LGAKNQGGKTEGDYQGGRKRGNSRRGDFKVSTVDPKGKRRGPSKQDLRFKKNTSAKRKMERGDGGKGLRKLISDRTVVERKCAPKQLEGEKLQKVL